MKLTCLFALLGFVRLGFALELPRNTPEAEGVPSSAILEFLNQAEQKVDALHSVMIVRHGAVIAEGWWAPYSAQSPHQMYSLSKSFTSTAVGLAIAEGKFTLDDQVLKFFPEDAPANPGKNLQAMRVRDLLRMQTGHEVEPGRPADQSWKKLFLQQPVKFKPGTHFLYNTSATYMLSAIVEKTSGMSLLDYLTPRLFEPLGIQKPTWEKSPEGIAYGGSGLNIRTEDIARLGLLYLHRGNWQGKQLLPEKWVDAATSLQTSNGSNPASDWDQGYGYQFWQCRNGCYRGDGAFGQYCIVMPKQDAVIAITSGVGDMQGVLNLVWDILLPAMKKTPLDADTAGNERLSAKLSKLTLPMPEGSATSAEWLGKTYHFESNPKKIESVRLENKTPNTTTMILKINGVEAEVKCGKNEWAKADGQWSGKIQKLAASGAWTENNEFTAKVCLYETPFIHTVHLKFHGDEVEYDSAANVGFGGTKEPHLIGKREL